MWKVFTSLSLDSMLFNRAIRFSEHDSKFRVSRVSLKSSQQIVFLFSSGLRSSFIKFLNLKNSLFVKWGSRTFSIACMGKLSKRPEKNGVYFLDIFL